MLDRLPRAEDVVSFVTDPLAHLARARLRVGDVFVLHEGKPLLSREEACKAVVAVFGAQRIRQVLTNSALFAMPSSASIGLALPTEVAMLSRSLHSMVGDTHDRHKRQIARLLSGCRVDCDGPVIARAIQGCLDHWRVGTAVPLLESMRQLTLAVAAAFLLGEPQGRALAPLLQKFFFLRREATSIRACTSSDVHRELVVTGRSLDRALRGFLRQPKCPTAPLAALRLTAENGHESITEDEAVGHANILFVSATEPIAVALTWIFLLLSQHAGYRHALRQALRAEARGADRTLVDNVLMECLRLLPPNGLMARVTTTDVAIDGMRLPARCEVLLCPPLIHREASVFARPELFFPDRWRDLQPSPWQYLPFGAGTHACVGRGLALELLRIAVAAVLNRFDPLLPDDQTVDWRIDIMFMPRTEVSMVLHDVGTREIGGRWRGPVAELLSMPAEGP